MKDFLIVVGVLAFAFVSFMIPELVRVARVWLLRRRQRKLLPSVEDELNTLDLERCYFCGGNADHDSVCTVKIQYGENQRRVAGNKIETSWMTLSVPISRCKSCKSVHANMKMFNSFADFIVLVGTAVAVWIAVKHFDRWYYYVISGILTFLIIGFCMEMLKKLYVRLKRINLHLNKEIISVHKHPEVRKLKLLTGGRVDSVK